MNLSYDLRSVLFATLHFRDFLNNLLPFSRSLNAKLSGIQSMVHVSPTTYGCDLLRTPAFGYLPTLLSSSFSEYLFSETRGSPPRVLLDPMVQIHFALRDFAKILLCAYTNSFEVLSSELSDLLPLRRPRLASGFWDFGESLLLCTLITSATV
jgi:hypothetical protein